MRSMLITILLAWPLSGHGAEAWGRRIPDVRTLGEAPPAPAFELRDTGARILDYEKFGRFENAGSVAFAYVAADAAKLAEAAGAGIPPNSKHTSEPGYLELKAAGKLAQPSNPWSVHGGNDHRLAYYTWLDAREDPGVRLFFAASHLRAGGHLTQAIKAYHACIVQHPQSVCWGGNGSYAWSIADAAWGAIANLEAAYPDLGLTLQGCSVKRVDDKAVKHGFRMAVTPGRIVETAGAAGAAEVKIPAPAGKARTEIVRDSAGHWRLLVEGKPFLVQGVSYGVTPLGEVPWKFKGIAQSDRNQNGTIDIFDSYIDANANNRRDEDEPVTGDARILHELGANTIRQYVGPDVEVDVYRRMYREGGVRVLAGDFFGAYCVGSGAQWDEGTDYTNPEQRKKMLDRLRQTVEKLKNEEWVLMWLLGNENNLPGNYNGVNATRTNAAQHPEAYATLLEEGAKLIHELDGRPVGVGNVNLGLVEFYAKHAPSLDYIGVNSYPGPDGFGTLWHHAQAAIEKPILITEFGCVSYDPDPATGEAKQAAYLRGTWRNIVYHTAGNPGRGNALGGLVFSYLDEWWKDTHADNNPNTHSTRDDGKEEWFGVLSMGDGSDSPFLRRKKRSFGVLQELWKK
ncbi:MAG: hypothetical protein AMXMBFR7_43120 [Planctomycetota bacterium]